MVIYLQDHQINALSAVVLVALTKTSQESKESFWLKVQEGTVRSITEGRQKDEVTSYMVSLVRKQRDEWWSLSPVY